VAHVSARRRALAAALAIAWLAGAGCSREHATAEPGKTAPSASAAGKKAITFPVAVKPVEARAVDYVISAVGSIEAFEEIQVTARVAGAVERVRFQEGDRVKAGAALVEVEPERFQIAARSARATLERAEASRKDAELTLSRREKLVAEGVASSEELDEARTRVATTTAEVSQARASLALADLNVRDAYVRAPASGVMQTRTVRTGQYVQAGAVLATLVQRDPLRLRFEVPEHEAREVKRGMKSRFTVRGVDGERLATITHVAEEASEATRMVPVIAVVDEASDTLGPARGLATPRPAEPSSAEAHSPRAAVDLRAPPDVGASTSQAEGFGPGAFAEVRVLVGSKRDAPVIPQAAARPSARGYVAFVVEEGVAKERLLELGLRTVDGRVEVRSGLAPGEKLVVSGAEPLRDGATVRVDTGPRPAGASSTEAGAPQAAPTTSGPKG
jgi:RND family efflux transporter MFP subunit